MVRAGWLVLVVAGCGGKSLGVGVPTGDTGVMTTAGAPTGASTTTSAGTTQGVELAVDITEAPAVVEVGLMADLSAEVTAEPGEPVEVAWVSDLDGPLASGAMAPDGTAELHIGTLQPGWHKVQATATVTGGPRAGSSVRDEVDVGVCEWPALEDFSNGASIAGWTLFGNAAWDPGGWLEITGNIQNSDGAIYKTDRKVNSGNVAIEFDIATGGGVNSGADGFAVNVIDAPDEVALAGIVNAAANGGCLGYGTDGVCGNLPINSFHIEFDTWYNDWGTAESDPTTDNHVAIALNGNMTPLIWAPVPSLEDLVWRHIRVEIQGSAVTVLMDGSQIAGGTLPGFTFDGGYIGVSGSTGYASNYHRFDNLQLFDQCLVPEATTTP